MEVVEAVAALEKLEVEPELKTNITGLIKNLSQEAGKAKSDITQLKLSMEDKFKQANQESTSYKDFLKALADTGIEAKNAAELAEKLKIAKTKDDELEEAKKLLNETTSKLKEFETERQSNLFKSKIEPLLEKAIGSYKDSEGNEIKIAKDFINQTELNKPIDLENEPLVNDRLKKVLDAAYARQQEFFNKNNVNFINAVHEVPTGGSDHFSGNRGIDLSALNKAALDSGGSLEAIARNVAVIRAAKEKEKKKG